MSESRKIRTKNKRISVFSAVAVCIASVLIASLLTWAIALKTLHGSNTDDSLHNIKIYTDTKNVPESENTEPLETDKIGNG